nr:hypothetical protein BaRGS_032533 [Batillaria attramentaria]
MDRKSPPPPSLSATPATDGVLSVDNDPDRNGEKDQEENEDTFCNLLVENDEDDLNFRIADLVVLFVVPFVAMLYMYVRVGVKLGFSKLPVTTSIRSKRRIVRFLFTNILVFFASWLPFYLTDVIHDSLEVRALCFSRLVAWGKDHGDKIEDNAVYILLRFIFILAALSNSFINPLIYGLFNENFKVIIQDVLKSAFKGCCCGGNQVHLEPPPANPTSADVSSPGVNLINQHPAPGRRHNLIPRAPYVAFTKHDAVSHGAVLMVAPKESFRESI